MSIRSAYLGSADAKDVASLEPYGCRRAMVYRKAGVPVDDAERQAARFDSDEGPVYRGRILEGLIRNEVARKLGVKVHPWLDSTAAALLGPPRHDIPAWFAATPDGLIPGLDESTVANLSARLRVPHDGRLLDQVRAPGLLEIKTCSRADLWTVRKSGPRADHVAQVQHQLIASGASWALIAYLEPGDWRWAFYLIRHDRAFERDTYLPAAHQAWEQVRRAQSGIVLGASPDEWEAFLPARLAEGSKQCRTCAHRQTCWGSEYLRVMEIPTEGDAERMDGNPQWESAAADLIAARAIVAEAEAIKEDAEDRIKVLLGDAHAAEGGGLKVYYRPTTQRRLDTTALKKELPEVAAQYTKEVPLRALRVYEV